MDPADGSIYKKTTEDFLNEWSGIIILLLPEEDFTKTNSVTTNSIRFWQLIQPHKGIMFQALLGAIVYT
ncbi:hypothetical protein, partial [Acinetobacter baumannii]|uniref:hypothetical protein n=1 Tax=Acinetobacter baumannii TaxID=470 RepID=UPI0037D937D4